MVDTAKLRAAWVAVGKTQCEVAKAIGMSETTLCRKMQKGVFGTDEAEKIVRFLHIGDPASIFFASEVT